MSGQAAPQLSAGAAGPKAAAERLQENPQELLALLLRAAADGEWGTFVAELERAARIRGLKLLLSAPDGVPMRFAYERAGLPQGEWPIFLAALRAAAG